MKSITSAFTIFLIVCVIGTSVHVQKSNAFFFGLLGGGIANNAYLAQIAANTQISSTMESAQNSRELADTIAWQVAKQMVSNMTRSLINWINSGFQGRPAFIQDLNQFLIDALDNVAGEYIAELAGSDFICSPFRLDVQAALTINYQQARSGMPSGGDESMCTATGIVSNIENFLNGTINSWDEWLTVTANPQNTPYGAYLEAEAKLNARLVNAAGQEIEMADWGDGFMSQSVCEPVEGGGETCTVSTPGTLINEALSFQITTGPRSLIEADEVNELIGALVNQLALQMVNGINGLLGLSQRNPSTGRSYLDNAVADVPDIDLTPYRTELDAAHAREVAFLTLIDATYASATANHASTSSSTVAGIVRELETLRPQVVANIASTSALRNRFINATSSTGTSTDSIYQRIVIDFLALKSNGTLHSQAYVDSRREYWRLVLDGTEVE